MSIFYSILLGLVQGITEFLPISSSGHLVILQSMLGMDGPELALDIMLHMGTLAAVLIHYRSEMWQLIKALLSFIIPGSVIADARMRRLLALIILSSAPTFIIGYTVAEKVEWVFASPLFAAIMLLVTGTILRLTHIKGVDSRLKRGVEGITIARSLLVGAVQGIAVLPGISRSGATISAGLFLGFSRAESVRYSILISIPAVAGAQIWSLNGNLAPAPQQLPVYLLGALTALLVGYVALKKLIGLALAGRLYLFSYYCWSVGALALVIILVRG